MGGGKKFVFTAFESVAKNDPGDDADEDTLSGYGLISIFIPEPSAKAFMKWLKSDDLMVIPFQLSAPAHPHQL